MKKNLLRIIILSLCLVLAIGTFAHASFMGDVKNAVDNVKTGGGVDTADQGKVANFTYTVLRVVTIGGSIIGVIMLIIFGVRWMTANPAQKSKLKEEAWTYVIGAIFLFGAGPLATLVYNAVTQIG